MKNWLIALIVLLLVVTAGYWYLDRLAAPKVPLPPPLPPTAEVEPEPVQPEETPPDPQPQTEVSQAEPEVEPVVEEEPMPGLEDSDPLARETLGGMIGEDAVIRYLASDNLISRLVATVDALDSAQVPGVIEAIQPPGGKFEVTPNEHPQTVIRNEEGDPIPQYQLNPANYSRYTPFVEMLEAVNTAQFVDSYRHYYPLFQEAWQQMGYTEGEFNERLHEVIDELLSTPQVSDPVDLMKPEAFYLFVDPELEALSAGQKILIRMGNDNARRVKSKLLEIRNTLP